LHEQFAQQMNTAQSQTIIDMNALHAAHQQIDQQRAQLREQTAAAWLNLYNALNDEQKATVSADMKARWAKMERRHAKMRERFEQHHGAHHPAHEDAPPAAPAPGSPAPQ
jgi:Spy/CpxP family protein refolding chaperone